MKNKMNSVEQLHEFWLKGDEDLPLEPDLKHHVSLLLKHAPLNTVIIGEERFLELLKNVIISYEIFCDSSLKFFD